MNLKDLTREELILLNTDFGEELEKQAAAIVAEESEKIAEVQEIADSCLSYGAELAMQKIAEMEANYAKKEEEEEEEEEKKEEKKEEKSEEEKTASAMGQFILEGYWNTMMEKGAEYYGDKNIYLEELCKEAGYAAKAKDVASKALGYIKSYGSKAGKAVKKDAKAFGKATKQAVTGKGPKGGKVSRQANLKKMIGTGTGKGLAGAAALGAGYGGYKAVKD